MLFFLLKIDLMTASYKNDFKMRYFVNLSFRNR